MSEELKSKQEMAIQAMMDVECLPATPELDLSATSTTKIPLSSLAMLGVAFQPAATAIQAAVTGGGSSGLYYVSTKGMQMFHTAEGYIGSLKSVAGTVGGGQARMTPLPCDPATMAMVAMATVLMGIEKKLDDIQKTQEEILAFLEEKELAALQGNLNVLGDIMSNYKYNWDNATYKANKHILVQQIKKESEASIILYRDHIGKKIKKRTSFHGDQAVREVLTKLQTQFKDYRLALYLYSYSTFLEVMLLGNFDKGYLDNVEQRINEYSLQYRTLYTDCYNQMEEYSKTSIQSGVLTGLAVASKFMGEAIAKVPYISNSQLDENLVEAGKRLDRHGNKRAASALESLTQNRFSVTLPFVENIRTVNDLYNRPVTYLFDNETIYIQQLSE